MKAEILKMLRETDSYVSGQELCNKFGVSRTAVWKAINQLKENGYEIEAVQNKGYHLLSAPDVMDAAEIKSLLHTDWAGKETLYFETIDSTNTKAKELAEQDELPEVIKWDSNSNIKFVGDEDAFIDPEKAMEELSQI